MCLFFELCLNCIFYWFYRNFENKVGQMGQGPENGRFLRNTVCFHRVTGRKASPRADLQENGTAGGPLSFGCICGTGWRILVQMPV